MVKSQEFGIAQESQVNYFLKRAFSDRKDLRLFKNLRISFDEFNAQIDHLILHKHGFVVVESKSIHGELRVNDCGEWERSFKGAWYGIASPIQQATLQIEALKRALRSQDSVLLAKWLGMQKGFGGRRYDVLIAISSSARVDRKTMPEEISKVVVKSEFLADKVESLLGSSKSLLEKFSAAEPWFTPAEMNSIELFLREFEVKDAKGLETSTKEQPQTNEQNQSLSDVVETNRAADISLSASTNALHVQCKRCSESKYIEPHFGRFGYYVRCDKCSTNTALKFSCPSCKSDSTKVSKRKSAYTLICSKCDQVTPLLKAEDSDLGT
jgi:hypothetical protein